MDEISTKAIMAAILLATLDPPEDESICIFDLAAGLAEDLYAHVAGQVTEEHHQAIFPITPPKGPAN